MLDQIVYAKGLPHRGLFVCYNLVMQKRVMIVVNVPEVEADDLRKAIGDAGGGKLGNYSYCSFSVKGKGRFLPNQDANPTIGSVGQPELVDEERIEVSCNEEDAPILVKAIRIAHSYEEPAIAVYPLLDIG
jgi:hypothetical protein